MEIQTICNRKAVIVYHKNRSYLFSYGTLIISKDIRTGKYWRHFKNRELLSLTTCRHVREFVDYDPCFNRKKSIKDQVMNLSYKKGE